MRGKLISLPEAVRRSLAFGSLHHLVFKHRHHQGILVFPLALLNPGSHQGLLVDSNGGAQVAIVTNVVSRGILQTVVLNLLLEAPMYLHRLVHHQGIILKLRNSPLIDSLALVVAE